jgi:hypothetical protein
MEYQSAYQISSNDLQTVDYDIFILASGYEQRSIYLPVKYKIKALVKIALAFSEKAKELNRRDNDSFLAEHGFKLIILSGEESLDLDQYLKEVGLKNGKDHLYMLVDYSSMTRVWYSGLINFLIKNSNTCDYLTVHFSYTPAIYNEPKKHTPVNINKLLSFPYKKTTDLSKPSALIIGLGLEKNRAEFIRKHINPALTILFYADPSNDLKYVEKVFKYNQDLIEETEVRNLISFPLNDLEKTDELLTDYCMNLRIKYNVFIAPVGPKVLSLLALLLASRYPDINVLRVSSGSSSSVFERIPEGDPLIYAVEFVSDELDS